VGVEVGVGVIVGQGVKVGTVVQVATGVKVGSTVHVSTGVKVAAGVQVAGMGVGVDVTAERACGVGEAGSAHAASSKASSKAIVMWR
jgi:hypothetical protein